MQNKSHFPKGFLPDEARVTDPYQVIASSFDAYGLTGHRRYLSTWMESVNKNDYWQEKWPSDLIGYYTHLTDLIQAVHRLYQAPGKRKTAADMLNEKGYPLETNLLHPALYVGWVREQTLWNYFPRSLSMEEYIDPYLVFRRFFSFHSLDQWLDELYELLLDGLSGLDAAAFYGGDRNMLLIGKNLFKLVEAAHLIDVREVACIGDFKKRNGYTLDRPCEDISFLPLLSMKQQGKGMPASLPEGEEEKSHEGDGENQGNGNHETDQDMEEQDKHGEENAKIHAGHAREDAPAAGPQSAGYIELIIRGSCLVDKQSMPLEPIMIKMPVRPANRP